MSRRRSARRRHNASVRLSNSWLQFNHIQVMCDLMSAMTVSQRARFHSDAHRWMDGLQRTIQSSSDSEVVDRASLLLLRMVRIVVCDDVAQSCDWCGQSTCHAAPIREDPGRSLCVNPLRMHEQATIYFETDGLDDHDHDARPIRDPTGTLLPWIEDTMRDYQRIIRGSNHPLVVDHAMRCWTQSMQLLHPP